MHNFTKVSPSGSFPTNKIFNEDCMSVMSRMPADAVTMTLTDIPYDVVSRKSNGLRSLDKDKADEITFPLDSFLSEVVRVTSGSIYIFCSTEQVSAIRGQLIEAGLSTRLCVWEKTNPSPMNGQHIWLSGVECCVFGKKKGELVSFKTPGGVVNYKIINVA